MLVLSLIALSACSSAQSGGGNARGSATMSPSPRAAEPMTSSAATSSAEGAQCPALGIGAADLNAATGLALMRVEPVSKSGPAGTVPGDVAACAFASATANHDSLGITGAADAGQDLRALARSMFARDEQSHGGCAWDVTNVAFGCNPLPGAPGPAATVVVVSAEHLWDVEIWTTTAAKLGRARTGIETYLGGR